MYMHLKRLSTPIVFLIVVSSFVFLDASKAFDRVSHSILFVKLPNREIPQYVIRMLSHWYENQQMCVRWGGTYCITPIFRVEEIFAIFANLDFARNFPPAKIISTANGISRNFPAAKFTSREIFLPAKIKF